MNIDFNYLEKLVPEGTIYNLEYANHEYKKYMEDEMMVSIFKESKPFEEYNLILFLKSRKNLLGKGEKEATLKDVLIYAIAKGFLVVKGFIPEEMEDNI